MTARSLADLWKLIADNGRKEVFVFSERRLTYAGLLDRVRAFAGAFDSAMVNEGDRVIISSKDDLAYVTAVIAAMFGGVVPVVVSPDTTNDRLRSIARAAEASAIFADKSLIDTWGLQVPAVAIDVPASERTWFGKSAAAASNLPGEPRDPRCPADPDGLAYILFTSGTTSEPTGVPVTRGNLFANLATIASVLGVDAKSRIFNDMILSHADGMVQGPLLSLWTGATVLRAGGVSLPRLEEWLNSVRAMGATHFLTVPTVWTMIDRYASHDDYFDLPDLVCLGSVAARLDEPLWDRIERRFGKPLINQYGLTETVASALYAGARDGLGVKGTIGKPIDCDAMVGDGGELLLRGGNVIAGYWRNPARDALAFTADGWFRTGDIVKPLPNGSYEFLGRDKSKIMSGGFLIRPDEIDEAMMRHPLVTGSCTVGISDPDFEEVAATALEATGLSVAEATEFARRHLEPRKVPRRIIVVGALPRGDAGKPKLGAVREMILAAATTAAPVNKAQELVFAAAAASFRCDPVSLQRSTGPHDIEGWDSFSHINLIFAIEDALGQSLPAARVAAADRLGRFVDIVEDLQK